MSRSVNSTLAANLTASSKHLQESSLTLAEKRILSKVLNESVPGTGVDAISFRARNAGQMERLDNLQAAGWLRRVNDSYRIPLATLAVLKSSKATALMSDAGKVFRSLVKAYRHDPRASQSVAELSLACGVPVSNVREALWYMLDASWYAGHSSDLFASVADATSVTPSEAVIRKPNWRAWLAEVQKQRNDQASARLLWAGALAFEHGGSRLASSPPPAKAEPADRITDSDWHQKLPIKIRSSLSEVQRARECDLRWLAAIGLRGIVEVVAMAVLRTDAPTFKRKLQLLHEARHLSDSEMRNLDAVVEVGNAAAHRGHKPTADDLDALTEVVEQLLKRIYVLEKAAARAKRKAPARATKAKSAPQGAA